MNYLFKTLFKPQFKRKDICSQHLYSDSILINLQNCQLNLKDFQKIHDKTLNSYKLSYSEQKAIWHELLYLTVTVTHNNIYRHVRNFYDLDFFLQRLYELSGYHSNFITVPIYKTLIQCFDNMQPFLNYEFDLSTRQEQWRKHIIELAGFTYQQHIYPDYTGSDQLFYDLPEGPEDPELIDSLNILKSKNVKIPHKPII